MLIKLGLGVVVRQAVEIRINVRKVSLFFACLFFGISAITQIVNQHFRMHLLLNEQRWRLHHQLRPAKLILATPDKLRIEIPVAPFVRNLNRMPLVLRHHRLILGRGDVLPRRLIVCEGRHRLPLSPLCAFGRHANPPSWPLRLRQPRPPCQTRLSLWL